MFWSSIFSVYPTVLRVSIELIEFLNSEASEEMELPHWFREILATPYKERSSCFGKRFSMIREPLDRSVENITYVYDLL